MNQKVATRILGMLGVGCVVASCGREAVDLVLSSAILMDWQMPIMDGLDATKRIRSFEGWGGRIPIVAMTANAMQGDREKCIAAGMNDYLAKPVTPAGIKEVLGKFFQQSN